MVTTHGLDFPLYPVVVVVIVVIVVAATVANKASKICAVFPGDQVEFRRAKFQSIVADKLLKNTPNFFFAGLEIK